MDKHERQAFQSLQNAIEEATRADRERWERVKSAGDRSGPPWYAREEMIRAQPTFTKENAMASSVNDEPNAAVRVLKNDTFWYGTCFSLAIIGITVVVCFAVQGCAQHDTGVLKLRETELLYKAVAVPSQDATLRSKITKALEDDEAARKGK